ncbi:6358_t:CDS:2 [Paraglomus occultum]|uniref:6358_t:CDS:1 n=1 Tax=Paraglomus occultum TaxID=144539 RepID=A0A9N9AMC6_9GLOM|nr:6358_t:CDS:2 [Paraglomus occultum]
MSKTQLKNLYTHRTATTERPCFICSRLSSAVLTTDDGLDWFYVCVSHLNDRGFAKPAFEPEPIVQPTTTPPKPASKEKSTKSKKKEADKEADKEKKDKAEDKAEGKAEEDKDKKKENHEDKEKKKDSTAKQQMATPQPVAARQPPKPKQYILHRDIFFLRESKKREKETKAFLSQFPSVPRTSLP